MSRKIILASLVADDRCFERSSLLNSADRTLHSDCCCSMERAFSEVPVSKSESCISRHAVATRREACSSRSATVDTHAIALRLSTRTVQHVEFARRYVHLDCILRSRMASLPCPPGNRFATQRSCTRATPPLMLHRPAKTRIVRSVQMMLICSLATFERIAARRRKTTKEARFARLREKAWSHAAELCSQA
jgi:hypothetical protein